MSRSEKQRVHILLGILALLALSAFLNFSRTPLLVQQESTTPKPRPVLQEKSENLPAVSMLQKNPKPIENIKRNIFQFSGQEVSEQQQDLDAAAAQTTEQQQPQEPSLPDVHYLGFYLEKKPSSVKLGAISEGGQIYVGGVGDILASRYQILQLRRDFIVLKFLQENKVVRFPLGKDSGPVELRKWTGPNPPAITGLNNPSN